MRIPMAFLADEANISQEGKLNVLGVFDRIAAAEFPVVHPRMVFAFRVQAEFGDGGRSFPVQVLMVNEANEILFEATGDINPPTVPAGEFSTANQVFTLVGMTFPQPGVYRFVVNVLGVDPHETHFVVSNSATDPTLN